MWTAPSLLVALAAAPLVAALPSDPAPVQPADGLLSVVPVKAYALAHCRDFAGLRTRAEANDWYRLLGSEHGEPLLSDLLRELGNGTHSDAEVLLGIADELRGEVVFFDTTTVAGLVSTADNRAALAGRMSAWIPGDGSVGRRTLEIAGGRVELVAWPETIRGWTGRAGHFAAFVDHPDALALFSGDDSEDVLATVTECLGRLGGGTPAPVVTSYLEAGGGQGGGVELFVDFTPLAAKASDALKDAVDDFLPDPTSLLGLERGAWLHASSDVFPGSRVEHRARLHLPDSRLMTALADTFAPLPSTLAADLPTGVWGMYALNWDLASFYAKVRAAYEEAGMGEGLATIDGGLQAANGLTGVDPIVDVVNQLEGVFAFYFAEPGEPYSEDEPRDEWLWRSIGFTMSLVNGADFLDTLESLMEVGSMGERLEWQELMGADAYLFGDDDFDGGFAILPKSFTIAATRNLLDRSLAALTRAPDSGLPFGSILQGALDENRGACFFAAVEMRPMRVFMLPESGDDLSLPPLVEGDPARDPFDAHLVTTARRTADGFDFHLYTR